MKHLLDGLRHGGRILRRNRLFALAAILSLALGIAANSVVFSVVDSLLLHAVPFAAADRLVVLSESTDQLATMSVAYLNYQDWKEQSRSFEDFGAFRGGSFNLLTQDGEPERVDGAQMSAAVLEALGMAPREGRLYTAADDRPGAERVAVVSEGLWRRRFGPEVRLGDQTITVDDQIHRVVGILPSSFRFPGNDSEIWLPLGPAESTLPRDRDIHPGLFVLARLRAGVSVAQARSELAEIARRLEAAYPQSNRGHRIGVVTLAERAVRDARPFLWILSTAVVLVLLLACFNVANLLLGRMLARQKEIALRTALGATPGRIVSQLLAETLVLAALGGGLGLLLARWALTLVVARLPAELAERLAINPAVLLFTAVVTLAAGLLSGLAPALGAARPDLRAALTVNAEPATGGTRQTRWRSALVVAELALSLLLLIGAALLIQSAVHLVRMDPGFASHGLLTGRLSLPPAKYGKLEDWQGFFGQLLERVRGLPEVRAAGLSTALPFASAGSETSVWVEDDAKTQQRQENLLAQLQVVTPGYLEALEVARVGGRLFESGDRGDTAQVVVIDDLLAGQLWPGSPAVGKRLAFERVGLRGQAQTRWREVVGVVRHVQFGDPTAAPRGAFYVSYLQPPVWFARDRPAMSFLARSGGDPLALAAPVRREVKQLDPFQPVYRLATLDSLQAEQLLGRRFAASTLGAFALLALVLAVIGVYGVASFMAAQRTHEIGVRMALGALPRDVLKTVLRRGAILVGAGLGLGLVLALAVSRGISRALYGITGTDPLTLVLATLLLGLIATVATLLPALRAARTSPVTALRGRSS